MSSSSSSATGKNEAPPPTSASAGEKQAAAAAKATASIAPAPAKGNDVHALTPENTVVFPADESTDPAKVILGGVFDTVHGLTHIIIGLFVAYIVGWLGFHISWVIFCVLAVWAFDQQYKETGWLRRFRIWQLDAEKAKVVAAEKESCEWLNSAMRKFYPIYSPGIADSVEASIIAAIESAMPVPPAPITHVSVQGVDLGVNPPSIQEIKSFNLVGAAWQMDCTLKYSGDIRIVVAAGIGIGKLSANVPVAVKDFQLEGRVRVTLEMASSPPFTKTMTVSFKAPPSISIGVAALNSFDLDKTPMLGPFLRSSIVNAVGTFMVYPQKLTIELGEPPLKNESGVVLDADARADAEVDPQAGQPMTNERATALAAQRRPEYIGSLVVVVKSASNLRAADKGFLGKKPSSDAYCRVFCGAKSNKTPVITSLNPEWNFEMRFLVEKAKKYQRLEIQPFDFDKVGKKTPLGRGILDFSALVGPTDSEPKQFVVPLEGADAGPNSSVTVQLSYAVD